MEIKLEHVDHGASFDFGRTAEDYARFRDIYPQSLYDTLRGLGIGLPGQAVLDFGTGTGVLPRHMADCGAHFTGTDVSPDQIEQAVLLSQGTGIEYRVCPAEETGLPDGSFDAATACQCAHYFDKPRFLRELRRVLKPDGVFCQVFMEWLPFEDEVARRTEELVLEWNPGWTGNGYRLKPYSQSGWTSEELELAAYRCWREPVPFTAERWCGRIHTCRGVGASMEPARAVAFDEAHRAMLREMGKEEFTVQHALTVEVFRVKR